MQNKKVAVILSGCGVFDGAEIYESTLVLLALDQAQVEYECLAPNIDQMHVINHLTGEEMPEKRNVLIEAARLARGQIKDLAEANPAEYSALIFPGGFGAAKNLSNFATQGADLSIQPDVLNFTQAIHQAGKPIGLICIAPAMAPKLIGPGTQCTIGTDAGVAQAIEQMGGQHVACEVGSFHIDEARKVVSTPAYMLAGRISEAAEGIQKLVQAVIKMM
ncbi:isoprenoid biosynthesis glyoxalase ElbB [Nitrincola tapanii]|uniref:Glyoxalase n=1 Tax=Nitrincola tapanii TaxID=1708751 RepID=A0A5A9W5Z5_9GAMM|nr:isoprenoid biosynthesis glyoxalase ElbB [Nitrincola tapanii]KAA0876197.1 isoprenoid biosynthesis glyoxalase ElbB [Nitrincola tapanii]